MPPYKRITTTPTNATRKAITLQIRPSKWMLTFALLGLIVAAANAVDEKKSTETEKSVEPSPSPVSPSSSSLSPRDEIYIDDEGEGSGGGRGGIHDDLEKEPDYSGSGFGPDDEDSSTGHHHSNSNKHHSSTSGTSSISGSGSKNTGNINTIGKDSTNRKDPTSSSSSNSGSTHNLGGGVSGSGDGQDTDDDDDDDFDDGDLIDHDDHEYEHKEDRINKIDQTHHEHVDKEDNNSKNHDNDDSYDEDDDDDDEIYTDVTSDPNSKPESDDKLPDRSGETNINKEIISKTNNEYGIDLDHTSSILPTDTNSNNLGPGVIGGNEVLIMNTKNEDRTASFFAQPGILAAVIGGAVVGLLCAILVVMFIVYRMRKKDEGSYALDEPKRSPAGNSYAKNGNNREFYA